MFGWVSAIGAKEWKPAAADAREVIGKRRAALGRRVSRVRLLPAVLAALLAGLVVAFGAYGVLRAITPVDVTKTAAEIDVTRVALTVVAGVGGVVALVIAYRRQRDLEQSRFVERFGAAASQLGATDVAVRIAGVYAMAGVADETEGSRRQQCIDVLCGYLRLPYDPDHGASGRTELTTTRPRIEYEPARGTIEERVTYRQNDREVRATIVHVIADHLRPEAEYSWSDRNFDFRNAHLENADFDRATFRGTARFTGATFSGPTAFKDTTFCGDAWFEHTTFSGDAVFLKASFSAETEFEGATFSGNTFFSDAILSHPSGFAYTVFSGAITRFDRTRFAHNTMFRNATFSSDTEFRGTTFTHLTDFVGVTFAGAATRFEDVDFGDLWVSFDEPMRWGPPAPTFDWDSDLSRKPGNVEPQGWPPVASPAP